jgi:hypothetical protein
LADQADRSYDRYRQSHSGNESELSRLYPLAFPSLIVLNNPLKNRKFEDLA